MLTLKALALAMLTRHWYDMGAETGWEEKAVIEHFPGKCSFYSLIFFNHMLSIAVFISYIIIFRFLTYPRDTEFNLLYIDFSFSEIGVRLAFHRVIFFCLYLSPPGFWVWFWAENLGLHPKLNAQRGYFWDSSFFLRDVLCLCRPQARRCHQPWLHGSWACCPGHRSQLISLHSLTSDMTDGVSSSVKYEPLSRTCPEWIPSTCWGGSAWGRLLLWSACYVSFDLGFNYN